MVPANRPRSVISQLQPTLPPLKIDPLELLLPLAKRTAAALLSALFAEDRAECQARLTRALRVDPSAALWVALRAAEQGRWLRSTTEAAQWLAPLLATEFTWPREVASVALGPQLAEQMERSFAQLFLVESLASDWPDEQREQLIFDALLQAALPLVPSTTLAKLPAGLFSHQEVAASLGVNDPQSPAATLLLQAQLLAAEPRAHQSDHPAYPAFQRAARAAKTWLEPVPNHLRKLPRIWEQLRQGGLSQQDFARQLAEEKLAALRELAYGASHEINNPLANIAGRAQTLLVHESSPDRQTMLAAIVAQAGRAHEMIADLMLFAQPPALQLGEVDLAEQTRQVVASYQSEAVRRQITLERLPGETPLWVCADPVQLQVCLRALLQNALEATPSGGTITITAERAPQLVVLTTGQAPQPSAQFTVVDTGSGLSASARRHRFDPFFSGREAGRGLGFGLSKCWRLVSLMGGRVDVADAAQGGVQATLSLPLRMT